MLFLEGCDYEKQWFQSTGSWFLRFRVSAAVRALSTRMARPATPKKTNFRRFLGPEMVPEVVQKVDAKK